MIVVGNKLDLIAQRKVDQKRICEFCATVKGKYIEISCHQSLNISDLVQLLETPGSIETRPSAFPRRISISQANAPNLSPTHSLTNTDSVPIHLQADHLICAATLTTSEIKHIRSLFNLSSPLLMLCFLQAVLIVQRNGKSCSFTHNTSQHSNRNRQQQDAACFSPHERIQIII